MTGHNFFMDLILVFGLRSLIGFRQNSLLVVTVLI